MTILPGGSIVKDVKLASINSATTPSYTLTIVNNMNFVLRVRSFSTTLASVPKGQTKTYSIRACSRIAIQNNSTDANLDAFTYPNMDYTKRYDLNPNFNLTVNNGGAHRQLFDEGLLVGAVASKANRKLKVFSIKQGQTVKITDENGVPLSTFTMPAANTPVNL